MMRNQKYETIPAHKQPIIKSEVRCYNYSCATEAQNTFMQLFPSLFQTHFITSRHTKAL